jgi:hypothetical protein
LAQRADLKRRIDQIWVLTEDTPIGIHDLLVRALVVGDKPRDKTPSGIWSSDHAGVVAKINMR